MFNTAIAVGVGQSSDICVNMTISRDNYVENVEILTMTAKSKDVALCPNAASVIITIRDSSSKIKASIKITNHV